MARNIIDTFIAPRCLEQITIVHQDDAILVIEKPSGLLSLSGKNPLNSDSVHARLSAQFPEVLLIHRLDFGTSGLLVLARSKVSATHLNNQFQAKQVKKKYIAILDGLVEQDEMIIDAPIARDDENFPKMQIAASGKSAQSYLKVLQRNDQLKQTRVEYTPKTGRTHQLRIHSAHIGHPILGCDIYGTEHSQSAAPRLCLHASELSFTHPETEQLMRFTSDCPF